MKLEEIVRTFWHGIGSILFNFPWESDLPQVQRHGFRKDAKALSATSCGSRALVDFYAKIRQNQGLNALCVNHLSDFEWNHHFSMKNPSKHR